MKYAIKTKNGLIRDIFGLIAVFESKDAAYNYAISQHDSRDGVQTYEIITSHRDIVGKITI
jgi:hypothetical protein